MKWINNVETPCYVIDEKALRKNLEILKGVREQAGCKILLAQKAFPIFPCYPLIAEYLDGCEASGLYEARLAHEEMKGKENHVFSPAYTEKDFDELVRICGHIVFNSPRQWAKYRDRIKNCGRPVQAGIRVNPECSVAETELYDPCAVGSRMGTTLENLKADLSLIEGIDGLHFHVLCEQGADALEKVLEKVREKFDLLFDRIKWVNFGGGHHITRPDYDVGRLVGIIKDFKKRYGVEVYLEPGEAVALNAGYLVTTVLDTFRNGVNVAITDASAACHMPDVLEMPYRPQIIGAGEADEKPHTYRLGGNTCLSGDIIGDYSFDEPLKEGSRLVLEDMAIYSMCKNNTFNGIPLPSIYLLKENGELKLLKRFGYKDFKNRLG